MNTRITKSDFQVYRSCNAHFWYRKFMPDQLKSKPLSDFEQQLADQGKVVEAYFYKLFPHSVAVESRLDQAVEDTQQLFDVGEQSIQQAAFYADGLFAQCDMVTLNGNYVDLYEIKSSSKSQAMTSEQNSFLTTRKDHLWDAAFQTEVIKRSGYSIRKVFLIELNKEYEKEGDLEIRDLFVISDITDEVTPLLDQLQQEINFAKEQLTIKNPPSTCDCVYKSRNRQCAAFPIMHPEMLGYTVHELARIGASPKRLASMIDDGNLHIKEVPLSLELLPRHRDQIATFQNDEVIIREEELSRFLDRLTYPIYFLDYETYAPGIPVFDGTHPYQQVPFQYSLHIQQTPNSRLEHKEYLHQENSNPIIPLCQQLQKDIGNVGSVIVWNKGFEGMCNRRMGETAPEFKDFLLNINARFFDLMEVFSKQMYVHKDFRGSSSIKKVLPVLVPELSYGILDIQDGGAATTTWGKMIFEMQNKEEIRETVYALLEYCKMDTLAMVRVLEKVMGVPGLISIEERLRG